WEEAAFACVTWATASQISSNCTSECPGTLAPGMPCSGHGECSSGMGGSGICLCDVGYGLADCSGLCPRDNQGNICGGTTNGGSCDIATAQCQCNGTNTGVACDIPCPIYNGQVCGGRGSCVSDGYSSGCACFPYFGGAACNETCTGHTAQCSGHGQCEKSGFCLCAESNQTGFWAGDGNCSTCSQEYNGANCIQQCARGANGLQCSGHGTCVGTMCFCFSGSNPTDQGAWSGEVCDQCFPGYFGANCTSECPGGWCSPCGFQRNVLRRCQRHWPLYVQHLRHSGIIRWSCLQRMRFRILRCRLHKYLPKESISYQRIGSRGLWRPRDVLRWLQWHRCVHMRHWLCADQHHFPLRSMRCGFFFNCTSICPRSPSLANASLLVVCGGRGTCSDGFNGTGVCTCDTGFARINTTSPCDRCAAVTCAACVTGFWGANCTQVCPACVFGNCSASTGTCTCTSGYWGALCQTQCSGGAANPCSGHGSCSLSTGACTCYNSSTQGYYTGTTCDVCQTSYASTTCRLACPINTQGVICNNRGTCFNGRCTGCHALASEYSSTVAICGVGCELRDAACFTFLNNCTQGFWGQGCPFTCPGTTPNASVVCNSNGVCNADTGICICKGGFYGDDCASSSARSVINGTNSSGSPDSDSLLLPCSGQGSCAGNTCECFTGMMPLRTLIVTGPPRLLGTLPAPLTS
ncbi:GPI-anchored surface protein, putative, partial [Bodo saltans]